LILDIGTLVSNSTWSRKRDGTSIAWALIVSQNITCANVALGASQGYRTRIAWPLIVGSDVVGGNVTWGS
jgi:hypothetical protein